MFELGKASYSSALFIYTNDSNMQLTHYHSTNLLKRYFINLVVLFFLRLTADYKFSILSMALIWWRQKLSLFSVPKRLSNLHWFLPSHFGLNQTFHAVSLFLFLRTKSQFYLSIETIFSLSFLFVGVMSVEGINFRFYCPDLTFDRIIY